MLYSIVPWEIIASLGDEPLCPWADLPTRLEELEVVAQEPAAEDEADTQAGPERRTLPSTDPADYLRPQSYVTAVGWAELADAGWPFCSPQAHP